MRVVQVTQDFDLRFESLLVPDSGFGDYFNGTVKLCPLVYCLDY